VLTPLAPMWRPMSPPRPSPSKFSVTFGLTAMLRTRAPVWL
jgi:hypothetical protein